MSRKIYPYSLKSADAKIAGVCSTIGQLINVDPTFIRIGFVAGAVFVSFPWAVIAYAAIGIVLAVRKRREMTGDPRLSDFERMGQSAKRRPTVHAMLNDLDANDRRMMAVDHHLTKQNDDLAREIEALRQEEK